MWILAQNGEEIVSTEAMDEIRVTRASGPAVGKKGYAVTLNRRIDGKFFALGFYRQKEQAVSVLREIFQEQGKYITCEGGTDIASGRYQQAFAVVPSKTYIMPMDRAEKG